MPDPSSGNRGGASRAGGVAGPVLFVLLGLAGLANLGLGALFAFMTWGIPPGHELAGVRWTTGPAAALHFIAGLPIGPAAAALVAGLRRRRAAALTGTQMVWLGLLLVLSGLVLCRGTWLLVRYEWTLILM